LMGLDQAERTAHSYGARPRTANGPGTLALAPPPPMLLAGTIYVRWPKVCAHYKLGDPKKVCGPRTMAYNQKRGEENCCFAHALGGPEHNVAQYKGKPFTIQEHLEELNKLKLTEVRDELKAEKNGNKKPPGTPQKVNGVDVYPTRPFA
jgi:hypothetical protein